ncbi:3-deoxy-D-manno-octulosonic acid transferase [Haliovirga abyssi]|uniref:3-deoxy-D-manno-octulosonic acid transferase n=1 Tax=Haliovirga abyssi TaxID=2996794 RepID=A0AAU9DR32_9FUSO|nr:glycosyltransferase N-terminal domain-containing protein [Haliovirga abyssi]BDU50998.1 hypothetical protein HLVA_15670 [Haliovirga abyssi]
MIYIYNILRVILILIGYLFNPDFFKKRVKENFDDLMSDDYIWIHMSSVGEVNLSEPLINKFLSDTDYKILLTIFTDTGMEMAKKKYLKNKRVVIKYFPLDNVKTIKKILNKINVKLVVLIETEIWFNLIDIVYKKTKIVLVNGRISDKSYKRYLKIKLLLKNRLNKITLLMMQTKLDSSRIEELGADSKNIKTIGNIKFNIDLEKYNENVIKEIKEKFKLKDRKNFVCGSTHDTEEEIILDIYKELKNTTVFLVPRHIDRCEKIEKELLKNFNYVKYSDSKVVKTPDIILVDKIGELRKLYQLADITFVGGTLTNVGGHSLLEPLFYRKTPIFGKYIQNVKEIALEIEKRGIGYMVKNKDEFKEKIDEITNENIEKNIKKDEIDIFFKENSENLKNVYNNLIDII